MPSWASACWNCSALMPFCSAIDPIAIVRVSSSIVTPRRLASCICRLSRMSRSMIWLTSTLFGGACMFEARICCCTVSSRESNSEASTMSSFTSATIPSSSW
jgi:hypothetical protein